MFVRLTFAATLCSAVLPVVSADDQPTLAQVQYEHLLKQHAPTLVTIKYVQQMRIASATSGAKRDHRPAGRPERSVLCSNLMLSGARPRSGGQTVPTDIRVLVGDDTQGVEATFTAATPNSTSPGCASRTRTRRLPVSGSRRRRRAAGAAGAR